MSTKIYYDGVDIVGSQPVPMFGLTQSMIHHGKRHGQSSSISLDGQLTGTEATMVDNIESLVAKFSENFKDLKVEEEGSDVLTFSNCKVESINFSESTLSRLTEYSISLSCYNNFSGTFGVLNPSEKVSYSENDDGTVSLTHDVSADGFSTSSSYNNAFNNAKNYVAGLTGWNPVTSVAPYFINGGYGAYPILLSTTETIDRLNATYSVSESYLFSTGVTDYTPVVNYSVSKETSVEDEVTTVSVEANAKGGKNLSVNWATYAAGLDLYSVATGWSETTDLLTQPLEYSVDEDGHSNTLSIRASYDNNKLFAGSNVYCEPSFSFSTDNLTDITTVSVEASFFSRGSWANQKSNIESYIATLEARADGIIGYLHGEANTVYIGIYGSTFALSKHCTAFSKKINDFTHEYSVSAEFSNTDTFPTTSPHWSSYNSASYSLNVTPSIKKYSANPSYNQNGYYLIYDVGINPREQVSFTVNTISNTSSIASAGPRDVGSAASEISLPGENAILEKLASTWLTNAALLDAETSNTNEHTRNNTVTQGYTQQMSSFGTNQKLIDFSYVPVNVIS